MTSLLFSQPASLLALVEVDTYPPKPASGAWAVARAPPSSLTLPLLTAITLASRGFSFAVFGPI